MAGPAGLEAKSIHSQERNLELLRQVNPVQIILQGIFHQVPLQAIVLPPQATQLVTRGLFRIDAWPLTVAKLFRSFILDKIATLSVHDEI